MLTNTQRLDYLTCIVAAVACAVAKDAQNVSIPDIKEIIKLVDPGEQVIRLLATRIDQLSISICMDYMISLSDEVRHKKTA